MTPLPKLASTLPVWRSNLKTGSTGVLSQSTGPPPAVPAPQRSYPQTLPSFGSMSMPADVPHLRPAGSSPQLRVTFGAGFGRPSPVIGFATAAAACADTDGPESEVTSALNSKTAQAPKVRTRGVVMTSPRELERGIIAQLGEWRWCRFAPPLRLPWRARSGAAADRIAADGPLEFHPHPRVALT